MKNDIVFTAGVIADTHTPDRVESLHPGVLDCFREANVSLILHAGDICLPQVVKTLETVAPVVAVAGNRDIFFKPRLPKVRTLNLAGVPVALMHGHGTVQQYLMEKVRFYLNGYRFEDFLPILTHVPVTTRVVVFGHSHVAVNESRDGLYFFNPGSACFSITKQAISVGLLHIFSDGGIQGKIVLLRGAQIINRKWVSD
jgi:uncharacterized protein